MPKKNIRKKADATQQPSGFMSILSNERTDFVLGFLLVLLAIVMAIAMLSFLSTGANDQSILEELRPGEWLGREKQFTNSCTALGAITAYFLITCSFGLAAFVIPLFMLVAGLNMMRLIDVSIGRWFLVLAVIMLWASVVMAKFLTPFMGQEVYNPGGRHGLFCVENLENMIGTPGLLAVLFLVAVAFLTVVFKSFVDRVHKAFNWSRDKIKLTVVNSFDTDANETTPESGGNAADEQQETPSTVVDLPIDTTPDQQEQASATANKTGKEAATETKLAVEVPKEEAKAKGKDVAGTTDLSLPINPKEPYTMYTYPPLSLLKHYDNDGKPQIDMNEIRANNDRIVEVLRSFGVQIKEIKATVGPTITLYEITPAEGVRISKIRNLEDDIALSLSALGIRIIAPIPGKGTIGIEVPNKKPNIVSMESIINSKKFQETRMDLPIALGKTITNEVYMIDLAKVPHLLVAGATGQGKSVGLNAIITSLLYKKHPNELKFVLVDPKKVEFSIYTPIAKHFMATLPENDDEPIITDVKRVVRTLKSLCTLMDSRYDLLKKAGTRNVKEYNEKYLNHLLNPEDGHQYMPYIVVIIDEFGDLIMTAGKEIELPIARIAQLARAVGIHMVIATQRPTTNIITGTIKANFPGRMAFKVSAMIDSRTILDRPGANQLVGRGDMLVLHGNDPVRVQCAFVDTPEVVRINEYIENQPGPCETMELPEPAVDQGDDAGGGAAGGGIGSMKLDSLFEQVARAVVNAHQGSTSMIQRDFEIGFNRAGRIMIQLEKAGIVGPAQGSKPRDVLIMDESQLEGILRQLRN